MEHNNLLEILKAGKRNIHRTVWPGTKVAIAITVLTEQEMQDASFATERLFKTGGIEINPVTIGPHANEEMTQILARAIVDPSRQKDDGSYERFFANADELRGLLGRAAKDQLIDEYNAFEAECNPSPKVLSADEFEAIVESVKKNQTHGSALSFATLKQVITYLDERRQNLRKVSGSTSMP